MKMLAAAAVAAFGLFGVVSDAWAEPGVCQVTAGTTGGQKFATIKCALDRAPRDFVIRTTQWEKENAKAYANLLSVAGRTFKCELKKGTTETGTSVITIHYEISECH